MAMAMAITKTMAATAMFKSTENNQTKAATASETATATEIATVTAMMAAVTGQQRRLWWQRQWQIAEIVCLMRLQYFGWGGYLQGHASSHFSCCSHHA
jgi:hypothetical protein